MGRAVQTPKDVLINYYYYTKGFFPTHWPRSCLKRTTLVCCGLKFIYFYFTNLIRPSEHHFAVNLILFLKINCPPTLNKIN